MAFAFTWCSLSNSILLGNDISYGVYIYHVLVVNVMVELGYMNNPVFLLLVVLITVGTACKFLRKNMNK
jgi:peptidoglycan/LPS O-acetylase OafA/YrhL